MRGPSLEKGESILRVGKFFLEEEREAILRVVVSSLKRDRGCCELGWGGSFLTRLRGSILRIGTSVIRR